MGASSWRLLPFAAVAAALLVACQVDTQQAQDRTAVKKPTYPKLESELSRLVERAVTGEPTEADALAALAPVSKDGSVAVTIRVSGAVDEVVRYLASRDVTPSNVGEDVVEAYVPLVELPGLADEAAVVRVELVRRPQLDQGARPAAESRADPSGD